jgi:hypothetical protein
MACSTRPGPAAFRTFIDETTGLNITQDCWHELRQRAADAGYPVGKRTLPAEDNTARIEALIADLNIQRAEDADDLRAALADTENTEATLSVIDYLTDNGVENTLNDIYGDSPNSKYEWEEGTITLPSAAVAPMKKALRDHANKFQTDTLAAAKDMVKKSGTKNSKEFKKWLNARQFDRSRYDHRGNAIGVSQAEQAAENFLMSRLGGLPWDETVSTPRVTVPTVAELEKYGIKKMTNKDSTFTVFSESGYECAEISFNDRKVTWEVWDNNHAVDEARKAPLAKTFFGQLSQVKWTRGTGGVIVGNDEYNQDDREFGGGANYTTGHFGPVGDDNQLYELMSNGFSRKQAVDYLKRTKG